MQILTVSVCRGMLGVLDSMSKAADAICDGNLVERHVRSQNDWGLLPTQVHAMLYICSLVACVPICVHTYICVYVRMHECTIHTDVRTYIHIHVCMYVCMYVCTYVYMHACVRVCVSVYVCT